MENENEIEENVRKKVDYVFDEGKYLKEIWDAIDLSLIHI